MAHPVTLLPGEGVGPIVCDVAATCVQAAGADVAWELVSTDDLAGCVASVKRTGVMLKGRHRRAAAGETSFTVRFRKAIGVWAIVRHAHNLEGLPSRGKVDIVTVREASEDIYAGFEHESTAGVFESVKVTTRAACERISRFAFELARARGRKRVTTVHKANILKKADGMFLRVSQEIAAQYPDIQHDDVIVDALCMNIVRKPHAFDVLLAGNLFGDIVSDCAAGMAGGLPVATGVCHADGAVVFENPHGATVDAVGPDGANPYPALLLSVGLLAHIGEHEASGRLDRAVRAAVAGGVHTADMSGAAPTSEVRQAVLDALARGA